MAALELYRTTLFTDANLTAYYRMEGNSNDSKGSNNGTDTSVTYSSGNGKFGQGGGYAVASSSKSVFSENSAWKQTGNFSALFWLKTSASVQSGVIHCEAEVASKTAGWYVQFNSAGKLQFVSGKNSGTTLGTDWQVVLFNTAINDGAFHFVACVYDGSNLKISVDGSAFTTAAWTGGQAYQATTYLRFGCQNQTGTDNTFLDGALDDIAIFSRALTITEVQNHYNGLDPAAGGTGNFFTFF